MKRLAMLVVAGMAALLIAACGENAPKQPESKTEVIVEQPVTPAEAPAAVKEDAAAADAQAQE